MKLEVKIIRIYFEYSIIGIKDFLIDLINNFIYISIYFIKIFTYKL